MKRKTDELSMSYVYAKSGNFCRTFQRNEKVPRLSAGGVLPLSEYHFVPPSRAFCPGIFPHGNRYVAQTALPSFSHFCGIFLLLARIR